MQKTNMNKLPYLFLALFVLLPLLMLLFAAWVAGTTTLRCLRLEPQQVDCTVNAVGWLGLGAIEETRFPQVQSAQVHSYSCEETRTINGKEQRFSKTCQELAIVSSIGKTHPGFPADTAAAINDFLRSDRHEWTIQTSSWSFALGLTGFAGIWSGVGWLIFRATTGQTPRRG
jgi:hypothetical protein